MYPAQFEYLAVRSFDNAIDALARFQPGAKILAGGASLIPLMKLRLAEPSHIVDINSIADADYLRLDDGNLVLGPLLREADLGASALVRGHVPILSDATAVIADPIVRNMGTVVGNLAHADPANDHPATMMALGAEILVLGPRGQRVVPAGQFFLGLFETALKPDEMIVELRVPLPPPNSGGAYVKFERQVGDFAVAGAAATVVIEDKSTISAARIVLTNAGPTPLRVHAAETTLIGARVTDELVRAAGEVARDEAEPWSDLRGSSSLKQRLAGIAVQRALRLAIDRAEGNHV